MYRGISRTSILQYFLITRVNLQMELRLWVSLIDWLFVYLLTRFALPEYDFEKASPILVGYLT